ncbi:MAG: PhoU domain-containing protein [Planctomycetota bacterium]|jgi:phosphate uptake regulator
MFFKKLFEIWTGQSLYNDMLNEFIGMLDKCTTMFGYMHDFFSGEKEPMDYKDEIFRSDKEINEMTRTIRKQVIEHLTVNPGEDLAACLILMSVVKDAERIGDFCKNMWEAIYLYGKPILENADPERFKIIDELTDTLNSVFGATRNSFMNSNSELADSALKCTIEIAARTDKLIEDLFCSELPTKQVVLFTLFSRYMKRIASHLGNIASTVILPLHMIDFPDKPTRKGGSAEPGSAPYCAQPPEE